MDNEWLPNNQGIVLGFSKISPHNVVYIHQPEPGIPFARNSVLDEACRIGADWVAFIDDDETASSNWLLELLQTARKYEVHAVQGMVLLSYPDPRPFWAIHDSKFHHHADGQIMGRAETSNVLISSSLFRSDQRFDERLRFTGGEDTLFFTQAVRRGARIVFSKKAIVIEHIPRSKSTFCYQAKISRAHATIDAILIIKERGYSKAIPTIVRRSVMNVFDGTIRIFYSLFLIPFSSRLFRRHALRASKKIMAAVGMAGALLGLHPQPYRRTHGE